MACLRRTQGWLPKHPWLKNKNWGAVVCPQLWDSVPAHWNVEPWRGPYTLYDRLPTPSRETSAVRLWGSDCPSPVQPPAHYPLLHLPSAQHTYGYPPPPWIPHGLSDALPLLSQYQLKNMLEGLSWPRRRKRCLKIENKEKTKIIMY